MLILIKGHQLGIFPWKNVTLRGDELALRLTFSRLVERTGGN